MGAPVYEPGILRPQQSRRHFDYRSHDPGPLAELINNFWTVHWDLPEGASYTAQVLPFPSVNLSVTSTEADVTGLVRRRYLRLLSGRGYAVGARFRPGCFRPFMGSAVSELTDRHRPFGEVLGRATARLEAQVGAAEDPEARVRLLADFLQAGWPDHDATALMLADLVEQVAADRSLTRVARVVARSGLTVRHLQRLFAEYVGAGPKWVIQRCRLQDAAARASADAQVDWAALAAELGFADQAHLTRAFTATIGSPPAAYARQSRAATR